MRKYGSAPVERIKGAYILKAALVGLFIVFSGLLFFREPGIATDAATVTQKSASAHPVLEWLREVFRWLSSLY